MVTAIDAARAARIMRTHGYAVELLRVLNVASELLPPPPYTVFCDGEHWRLQDASGRRLLHAPTAGEILLAQFALACLTQIRDEQVKWDPDRAG